MFTTNPNYIRIFNSLIISLIVVLIIVVIGLSQTGQSATLAFMVTPTATKTPSPPDTATPTPTNSPTATATPTNTTPPTKTPTSSATPTKTPPPATATFTPEPTATSVEVADISPTAPAKLVVATLDLGQYTLTTKGLVRHKPTQIWKPTPRTVLVPTPLPWPLLSESETDLDSEVAVISHLWFGRPFPDYGAWGSFNYPYGTNSKGNYLWHYGIDLAASYGNIIRALGDGTIVHAGPDDLPNQLGPWPDFYGQAVVIRHDRLWDGQPVFTLYGHVSEALVELGQHVSQNEPIAKVGSGGVATGAHLHVEVRIGANTYNHTGNPDLWIRPDRGYGVVVGRVVDAQGYFVPVQLVTLHDAQDRRRYRRETFTYPNDEVNYDPRYVENFSFADVPVGDYILNANFDGEQLTVPVTVHEYEASLVVIQAPLQLETAENSADQ